MNKKKVLITGANGFVGSCLCKTINDSCTIVKQVRKIDKNKLSKSREIELNINGETDWFSHLVGIDTIVHLASIAHNNSDDLKILNEVNVNGTDHLGKQAAKAGVRRFIFISSIGVLGCDTTGKKIFDDSSIVSPHSQYTQSKFAAENALLKIADETDLEVVIIRPVLVYGKNAPGNFGKLVNLINKVPVLPFGFCNNKRSFISVDNLSNFISVCIEHPKAKNEIFCISDGVDISIKEFTKGIAKGLDKRLLQFPVPNFIFKLLGKLTGKQAQVDQLVGDLQVNSSRARNLLNWNPPFTMADTFSRLTKK
ncbi:NAD-dependent epimerase/dehydratase family protein [Colwellia sp. Bg11-28]|jgi:nucleoside-diphosphate-sugar epimerase|uniref:NAD-dependent epimerase/dehydratase family protein n=1 Tax=Colwellia sp. Bg11-28 TaxID=2058305 RepID=UPI000C32BCDE|nr:NAD-dependent epimerase/dehydratase family protein [Colwellia sp. Bg11-28]PKH87989.1 UDP-glucose 4-epimerase [Colwellia sp. Bg11-28]